MSASKAKWTVFDAETTISILNMRAPGGVSIKDLRMADGIVAALRKALPPVPEQPRIRDLKEGETHSPEEQKEYQAKVQAYVEELNKRQDQEIEVDFTAPYLEFVAKKLEKFSGFFSDEDARKKVLSLADKVGL